MPVRFAFDQLRLQADLTWASLEWASKLLSEPLLDRIAPYGDGGTAVLTLPGFGGPEVSLSPLNRFLTRHGFQAEGWGQGVNRGPRSAAYVVQLIRVLGDRVQAAADRTGRKVALVGQSLGGIYARELARALPRHVDRVITLGSPAYLQPGNLGEINRAVAGYVRLATGRRAGDHLDDPETASVLEPPPGVPLVAVFSAHDAVASPVLTKIPSHQLRQPNAPRENVEIIGSHCGMGVSPVSLLAIADRLTAARHPWQRFDPERRLPAPLLPLARVFYPA